MHNYLTIQYKWEVLYDILQALDYLVIVSNDHSWAIHPALFHAGNGP